MSRCFYSFLVSFPFYSDFLLDSALLILVREVEETVTARGEFRQEVLMMIILIKRTTLIVKIIKKNVITMTIRGDNNINKTNNYDNDNYDG